MDNRPIGVFDSGVGGLTVMKEIIKLMPNEEICYFGDSKRAPYGNKDKETLNMYAKQIATFLTEKNVKALVVACNTMTATSLPMLIENFDLPIIDIITPGVLEALDVCEKSVCLLATQKTVESEIHKKMILDKNPAIDFCSVACLSFVSVIEAGLSLKSEAYDEAYKYLKDINFEKVDTVILGCTHYPLMENAIRKMTGENINIVNPAIKCANIVKETLEKKNMLNENNKAPNHQIFASDVSLFDKIMYELLKIDLKAQLKELGIF